jgi:hypothetical protein
MGRVGSVLVKGSEGSGIGLGYPKRLSIELTLRLEGEGGGVDEGVGDGIASGGEFWTGGVSDEKVVVGCGMGWRGAIGCSGVVMDVRVCVWVAVVLIENGIARCRSGGGMFIM